MNLIIRFSGSFGKELLKFLSRGKENMRAGIRKIPDFGEVINAIYRGDLKNHE
jgi:hypothetical protein